MAMIPLSVINEIRKGMFQFLCVGNLNHSKFHLTSSQIISVPNNLGGWGLKHPNWFSFFLSTKSLWRGLFGEGPWKKFLKPKYIKCSSVVQWIKNPNLKCSNGLIIWRGVTVGKF